LDFRKIVIYDKVMRRLCFLFLFIGRLEIAIIGGEHARSNIITTITETVDTGLLKRLKSKF
jgi:hypothetical protein